MLNYQRANQPIYPGWCHNHLENLWSSSMGRMTSHIWKRKFMFETTNQYQYLTIHNLGKWRHISPPRSWNLRWKKGDDERRILPIFHQSVRPPRPRVEAVSEEWVEKPSFTQIKSRFFYGSRWHQWIYPNWLWLTVWKKNKIPHRNSWFTYSKWWIVFYRFLYVYQVGEKNQVVTSTRSDADGSCGWIWRSCWRAPDLGTGAAHRPGSEADEAHRHAEST